MNYKLQINNQFLKIITDKSILNFLEDNAIEATEGKLIDGRHETIIKCSIFTKNDTVKKIKKILGGEL